MPGLVARLVGCCGCWRKNRRRKEEKKQEQEDLEREKIECFEAKINEDEDKERALEERRVQKEEARTALEEEERKSLFRKWDWVEMLAWEKEMKKEELELAEFEMLEEEIKLECEEDLRRD